MLCQSWMHKTFNIIIRRMLVDGRLQKYCWIIKPWLSEAQYWSFCYGPQKWCDSTRINRYSTQEKMTEMHDRWFEFIGNDILKQFQWFIFSMPINSPCKPQYRAWYRAILWTKMPGTTFLCAHGDSTPYQFLTSLAL